MKMRAIVQRVIRASVSVGDELVGSIGKGICVLVGVSRDDGAKDIEYMVRKILNLRIFDDENGKRWNKSVMDKQYEVLCVSQFTLYSVMKGNKPDFHNAMGPEQAPEFYEEFLNQMKRVYKADLIKDGRFGAYMQVNIQNDGPVTIQLESPVSESGPDGNPLRGKAINTNRKQSKVPQTKHHTDKPVSEGMEGATASLATETEKKLDIS